jgi:myo-inositol-1(or 4)-monophosphatase
MLDKSSFILPKSIHKNSAFLVARHAALEAGKILKYRFGLINEIQFKGKRNIVTEADKLSEKAIIKILENEFPDFGILSEESPEKHSDGEFTWIIDPLDGTNNYYFGIPLFCVNIALAWRGDVVMGITYDPMRKELFHGIIGKGCFLNIDRIFVSKVTTMDKASVAVDMGYDEESAKSLINIAANLRPKSHCLRLLGSSSLGLAYVASGRLGLYFHKYIYPWDIASGLLMIHESGGEVRNFQGSIATIHDKQIIAANKKLLKEFLTSFGEH